MLDESNVANNTSRTLTASVIPPKRNGPAVFFRGAMSPADDVIQSQQIRDKFIFSLVHSECDISVQYQQVISSLHFWYNFMQYVRGSS